ncbi:proteasome subunit beta type 7 precursor, putative [Pediculus humanus corporis]|uniref:Proteasome subunit beta n=1 Tax=Pediculus humanus subsp. corporis TaxID=121224 RepID=E0VJR0_PEDHC|nr:proteasome subunit beta type 7 precursor, putative [Pediculus humanus corporis]EEB13616.1 proteasome subunit beta type 7 precursor, putative [Pediculus humanus corporis]
MAAVEGVAHIPGFSFENCRRNQFLLAQGLSCPKATKTGTTIVGVIFKDGVILGADTRATEGSIVSDKNCSKIHYIADNMYCCGAGTAADTEMTTQMIASQLKLQQLNTGREVPVVTANRILKQLLFRYQGHIGAALVLGGVDSTGPHIFCIHPHGSTAKLPYATMGSGSLAAMAVFEAKWKPDLEEEEAKQLVSEAIQAGIFNDLGSGGNVDMCVIKKGSVKYIRPYLEANKKGSRQSSYRFPAGTTAVLNSRVIPLLVTDESVTYHGLESMDVSS